MSAMIPTAPGHRAGRAPGSRAARRTSHPTGGRPMLLSWLADRSPLAPPDLRDRRGGAWLAVVYVAIEVAIDHTRRSARSSSRGGGSRRRGWSDPDVDAGRFLPAARRLGSSDGCGAPRCARRARGDPLAAVRPHPGGWLLLVAGMRGIGRSRSTTARGDAARPHRRAGARHPVGRPGLLGTACATRCSSRRRSWRASRSSRRLIAAAWRGCSRSAARPGSTGDSRSRLGTVFGVLASSSPSACRRRSCSGCR